jgi:quinol monooxygenase YgiN
MIYQMVTYKIREDQLDPAKVQIAVLLNAIRKHEPSTLVYQVFNSAGNPSSFIHFMVFPDAEAHLVHISAPHIKQFVEALLPFCQDGPDYSELRLIESIAALGYPLKRRPDFNTRT